MCEIFPEVENCCYFLSVRVGMLVIAVLAIMTGALTLSLLEHKFNVSMAKANETYRKTKNIKNPTQAVKQLHGFVETSLIIMSVLFMFGGLVLLFADLSDQEGFAQIFVWVTFVNIMIGALCAIVVAYECLSEDPKCLLLPMKWLSSSGVIVLICVYLMMWYYFISVANSYVLNGYS